MGSVITGPMLFPAGKQAEEGRFFYKNEPAHYLFSKGFNRVIRFDTPDGYKYLVYQGRSTGSKFVNGYYAYVKYIEENVNEWKPLVLPSCKIDDCNYSSLCSKYIDECPLHAARTVAECNICGSPDPASSSRERLLEHNICFLCHFWTEYIDYDQVILIDGQSYNIGPEKTSGRKEWRGFAGRKFNILLDGEVITTTNLWHQGKVPERFLDRFKQHGEFVN